DVAVGIVPLVPEPAIAFMESARSVSAPRPLAEGQSHGKRSHASSHQSRAADVAGHGGSVEMLTFGETQGSSGRLVASAPSLR
ncbi:MAG TPA: hypothetical protein VMU39_14300, partial [Solirubrobacteraceae bacterium]|nr:hypothetical protein [Solirubrobacteraceae bacterium]